MGWSITEVFPSTSRSLVRDFKLGIIHWPPLFSSISTGTSPVIDFMFRLGEWSYDNFRNYGVIVLCPTGENSAFKSSTYKIKPDCVLVWSSLMQHWLGMDHSLLCAGIMGKSQCNNKNAWNNNFRGKKAMIAAITGRKWFYWKWVSHLT